MTRAVIVSGSLPIHLKKAKPIHVVSTPPGSSASLTSQLLSLPLSVRIYVQVYITVIGSSCKWPKKRLTTLGGEELVPGSLRTFHITGPALGEVCQVVIEVHDSQSLGAVLLLCTSVKLLHFCWDYL